MAIFILLHSHKTKIILCCFLAYLKVHTSIILANTTNSFIIWKVMAQQLF